MRACFFLRFDVQKRAPSLSYCFAPISTALRPSRPAAKPALMVLRHWSSRLALRPASNFVSSYKLFVFAAISITLRGLEACLASEMAIKTAKPVNGSEYHQKCKHCEIPVWSHAQNIQSSPTQSQLKPVKSQSPVHTH